MTATQAKALERYYTAHQAERLAQDKAARLREKANKIGKGAIEVGALEWLGSSSFLCGKRHWYYVPLSYFFAPGVRERVGVCHHSGRTIVYCVPAGKAGNRIGYIEQYKPE